MLKEKLTQDMYAALKAKEMKKLNVLRGLLSVIKNSEIDKKAQLTDEEIMTLLRKQIKMLNESVVMFEKGGRADLVIENKAELALVSAYLPAEITDEELEKKVREVITAHAELVGNIGRLTGMCIGQLKNVADGSRIAGMVKKVLSANS